MKWLKQQNGLFFKDYGTVLSLFDIPPRKSPDSAAQTIEIRLQAERWQSGSFVSFYNPKASVAVSMRESLADFELVEYAPLSYQLRKKVRLRVPDVFHGRELKLIAVSSGQVGVKVYVNGVRAAQAPSLQVERALFHGRLIVGDAPNHTDTWPGEICGIAIYDTELSQVRIARHYQTWKDRGQPTISGEDHVSHLYLMDERGGSTIHDKCEPGMNLAIPKQYTILGKIALRPMWNEFEISRSFAASTLKNIIGFVPLGVCFYLFMLICEWKRPVAIVVLAGFSVSLAIEVFQIFLPTRDSGTTDLITNTLGTWLGVVACQLIGPFRIISYLPTDEGDAQGCIAKRTNKDPV